MEVHQRVKLELPHDSEAPPLGKYAKKIENRILERYLCN